MTHSRPVRRESGFRLGLVGIILLPAIVLLHARHAGFVADDFAVALEPVRWSVTGLLGTDWGHSPGDPARYRPVVTVLYGIDQLVGRGRPFAFHVTNFLLHGVAAALLALLARRLTGSRAAGIVAGVLFVLHPAVHENVVWISGRTHSTATVFVLAALALLARPPGQVSPTASALAIFSAWAALSSYEAAVTVPGAVAMVVWLQAGSLPAPSRLRHVARTTLPYAVLVVAYLVFRRVGLSSSEATAITLDPAVAWSNARALAVRLLACGSCGLGGTAAQSTTFWATAGTLALSGAGAALSARTEKGARAPWLAGAALAAIWFVPFATFPGYTDRFAYASVAGLSLALATGLVALARRRPPATLAIALAVALPMAGLWTRQLRLTAADWIAAGAIAEAIPSQARTLLPTPPTGATLRFFRVPLNHGRAYVFITSFHVAIARAYGRDDLDVRFEHAQEDEAIARAVRERGACEAVLWWDGAAGRVQLAAGPIPACR